MMKRRNTLTTIILMTLMASYSLFQSCGRQKLRNSDSTSVNTQIDHFSGTGGFDGKVYISHGVCSGVFGISDAIEVANDYSSAIYTRQDCEDLSTHEPIDISSVQFDHDSDVLLVDGRVYDLQSPASDRSITARYCQGVIDGTRISVTATVEWTSLPSGTNRLTGTISLSDGTTTGPLELLYNQVDDRFRSLDPQPSTMVLYKSIPSADLEFSINGDPIKTVVNMNCSAQNIQY